MKSKDGLAVLLASGGMDSTVLAHKLTQDGVDFVPLFVDYGQHCAKTERDTLNEVLPAESVGRLVTLNISDVYSGSASRLIDEANLWEDEVSYRDMYLPYRNLLLLTVGAAFARGNEAGSVFAAFINSNHAQEIDCSTEFFVKLSVVLSDYGGIELYMPFRDLSKYEVAKIGIEVGAPIGKTFSCQASSTVPCGACPNCVDRLDALQQLADNRETETL